MAQFQQYPTAHARDGTELIVILQDGETRKELLTDVIPPPISVLNTLLAGLDTASNVAIAATDTVIGAFGKLQAQVTTLASPVLTVLNTALSGLSTATNAAVTAADTVLSAVGKLQAQISAEISRATGAEGLLAPKNNPVLTGTTTFNGPTNQTTSGTLTQGTYSLQSATGTASFAPYSNTFPHAGFVYNHKYVWNDGVVLAQDTFANAKMIVMGDVVEHTISDASVNGARIAHGAFMRVMAPVNTVGQFMGASLHFAQSVAPVVGSSPSDPRGNLYGMNPQVDLAGGATNYVSVMAGEADVSVRIGASVQYKWGWCITTVETDAVHGSVAEAALHIGAVPGTQGWINGILFSDFNGGGMPVAANGTVMKVGRIANNGPIPIAHGIDLTGTVIAGAAFKSPGFYVDGLGNLQASSASYLGVSVGANGIASTGPVAIGSNVAITGPVGISDLTAGALSQFTVDGHLNSTIGARITLTGNGATTPSKYIRVFGGTLQILNNAATVALLSVTDTGVQVSPAGGSLGFFGAGPQPKPAVTGARGGNTALASLLTQLSALGLITDSTSA